MKRVQTFGLLTIGPVLAAVLAGCGQQIAAGNPVEQPAATEAIDRVSAGKPEVTTLKRFTSQPGRIEAFEETPLFPKINGFVEAVSVDIGDAVKKDQVLIRLAVPEMHDEYSQMEALVAQVEADVDQASAAVRAAEAAVTSAEAKVTQAKAGAKRFEAECDRWKAEHERISSLADKGSVTKKLVEETLFQLRSSEAACQEANANILAADADGNEARVKVEKAKADRRAAEARMRVAQANLARSRTMLRYTEIRAPFDGIITLRRVDTGHYVHPASGNSSVPLLVVSRADKLRVSVDVPETEAALVDAGETPDPATIRVQALGGEELEAKVTRTGWSLDASNRSLRTELEVVHPDSRLRPGMYANVTILLAERKDVLTVPATAIIRDQGRTFVCVITQGKIERRPVELGLRSGDRIEVIKGLDANQLVVLVRADTLQDGQRVEVASPAK